MSNVEPERRARWCGVGRTGSAIFTVGSLVLPKRCPRCGSRDATSKKQITAYGDSKFVFGGVSVEKFTLGVPHCKPCVEAIDKALSKRSLLIIPVAIVGIGTFAAAGSLPIAVLASIAVALGLGLIFKPKPNEPVAGVSIVQMGKDKIAIRSRDKGWQADLQILNS